MSELAVKPSQKSPASEDSNSGASTAAKDVLLVHGVSEDGRGLSVLRQREDRLEHGVVHPLENGKPIHGEVVRLKPRPECPLVCDVEVAVPGPEPQAAAREVSADARKGPAQVASERYRENWDAIWKRPSKPELTN
ncbi:MAG TPA: hypothetical protein VI072_15775 [Polyangiaceae bacterium]